MDAERIIDALTTLRLAELERIDAAIHTVINHLREAQRPEYAEELHQAHGKTYRQELVKCGKAGCKKCEQGAGHGPYWYAYWSDSGRTRKQYIGKQFREV